MTHDHADHAAGAHFHPDSINPALEGARFCPRCGATPQIDFPRSLRCSNCGYAAFYNPKPVACAIPREPDGRLWLLRRGFDPSAGLWTFPGGFVDLGESVEQAARREAREELEIDVELTGLVGVYSRAEDRVLLIVFDALRAASRARRPRRPRCGRSPRPMCRGRSSRSGRPSARCATCSPSGSPGR